MLQSRVTESGTNGFLEVIVKSCQGELWNLSIKVPSRLLFWGSALKLGGSSRGAVNLSWLNSILGPEIRHLQHCKVRRNV